MPRIAEQLSRGGSGRRDGRDKGGMQHGMQQMSDGWNTVGPSSTRKVDLTRFGQVRSTKISGTNMNLAPGSGTIARLASGSKGWPTDNKDRDEKGSNMSRTHSTSNTYSVLLNSDQIEGRKSMDGSSNEPTSTPPERQKLVVLARGSTLKADGSPKPVENKWQSNKSGGVSKPSSISQEEAKRKIKAMVDEYWSVRDKKVRLLLTNPLALHCFKTDLVKTVTGSCRMYQRTSCQIFW